MVSTNTKLAEAIKLAEDAMAYVPEYFANKHGDAEGGGRDTTARAMHHQPCGGRGGAGGCTDLPSEYAQIEKNQKHHADPKQRALQDASDPRPKSSTPCVVCGPFQIGPEPVEVRAPALFVLVV